MKLAPLYYSASRLMVTIGGPLLTVGMLALLGAGGGAISAVMAGTLAAVGAALSVGGIIADFLGTRASQDGYLDQTEVGAQSNARYLVKELKANGIAAVTTEVHEQNQRADGKKWASVVRRTEVAGIQTQTQQG